MENRPFRIQVADPVLADLQARLARTRLIEVKKDSGWEAGTDPAYLRDVLSYWRSGYDWRRQEARLNQLPQFKASIDGTDLHFVHARGRGPRPVPLLLLHGWPDSFFRYHKVIRPFTDPAPAEGGEVDAFDVVVPSLPGFAFTGPVAALRDAPRANRHSARLIWRLMTEVLGYPRFAVAGGDGGSVIAQILAIDHPEAVIGIHLTDLGWHALNIDAATASKAEQKFLAASRKHAMADGAYAMVQMSQPRSLAAGLNDSPAGLASWILDRFHAWSDDGDIDKSFGKDDLLTNIMIYWVTQTIGASVFSYFAEARSPSLTTAEHVDVPVAVALFPQEPGGIPPRSLAERTLNVQRWTEMPRGGHFAALEEPELFVRDVAEFFRPLRELPARSGQGEGGRHVSPSL